MSDAKSHDAEVRFHVSGVVDAPSVLLAHSLGASSEMWAPQLPALERRFRVIRYDARGHGASSAPEGEYSLAQLGSDALAVLDATATNRSHVCGISMGGQVAMWLAVHAPKRVDRIVLANTGARIGTAAGWSERMHTVRAHGMAALSATVRGRWLTARYADRHRGTTDALTEMLTSTDPAGYLGCCAAIRDADLVGDLERISAPALVIAGENDPATTLDDARVLCDGLRDARLARLATAHLSNIEDADGFTRELMTFLEEERTYG